MNKLKACSRDRKSVLIWITFLLLFSNLANASGGGGGGDGPGTQKNYDRGKRLFLEMVVCESCPYSDMELNAENARQLLPELRRKGKLGKHLSYNERWALKFFIRKRFEI